MTEDNNKPKMKTWVKVAIVLGALVVMWAAIIVGNVLTEPNFFRKPTPRPRIYRGY